MQCRCVKQNAIYIDYTMYNLDLLSTPMENARCQGGVGPSVPDEPLERGSFSS